MRRLDKPSLFCILFASGWLVTIFVFTILVFVLNADNTKLRNAFNANATTMFSTFESSVRSSVSNIQIIGAFCAAFNSVDNETFGSFVDRLAMKRNVSLHDTIAWAQITKRSNLQSLIESVRSEVRF